MKKTFSLFSIILVAMVVLYGCSELTTPLDNSADNSNEGQTATSFEKGGHFRGKGNIVIANRASGSISVIDVKTDVVSGTFPLPASPNPAEPMYVVYVKQSQRVFVGDRANNQVVVFHGSDYSIETTIPAGAGVFHMWADNLGRQLWINNDIDNTSTVVNPRTLQVIATVPTPSDLVALGGKPHDVILSPLGRFAYVTVLGVSGDSDFVVQYDTRTFQETRRAAVGKDPHVSLTLGNRNLYVPCQNSDSVYVLNRLNMRPVKTIPLPGAHGAAIPSHGKVFYTTNLPGGGTDGIFAINTRRNKVIGSSDTPYPVPHNIAISKNSKKLYVTHSGGTSDKVTVYEISVHNPVPVYLTEVTVGFNPFGIAFAK
jgi:DNA-binding beta-propeller fold protein YncE